MNPQEQQILQQVLRALQVVHSSQSSANDRRAAQEFLEQFKNSGNLGVYAIHLVEPTYEDIIRHFGLQLIEYMISHQWSSLQDMHKLEIKNMLLTYTANKAKPILQEKQFIKTKLCALVIEIMKREWPQRMPDMLDTIIQLAYMGPTQCELSVIMLRTLAQDVSSEFSSDMDAERRKEIVQALKERVDHLFNILLGIFENYYKNYKESAANTEERLIAENILNESLQCSIAFINDWISLKTFFKHNFINIWCFLLMEPRLKISAAECLLPFADRKWADTDIEINNIVDFLSVFCSKCNEVMNLATKENMLDEYDFHKILAKIIGGFGSTNMHLLKEEHANVAKLFYDLVIRFMNYPSQVLCNEVLSVWITVFEPPKKDEQQIVFTKSAFFDQYYSPILNACREKMLREIGNPDNEHFSDLPLNQTSSLEFQDKSEYTTFFGIFRSRLTSLIKSIAEKKPELVLEGAANIIVSVLGMKGPTQGDVLTANGFCDITSKTYILWEGATTMLEWVIQGIPFDKLKPNNRCYLILDQLLVEKLFKFQTKDPLIQVRYLHTLQSLTPLYKYATQRLNDTLQLLFSHMQFRLDKEVNAPVNKLSEDSQAARRKAFSVFINLCNSNSGYLFNFLNMFVDNAQKLWSERKISSTELIMLYEAFVVISNEWKDYNRQYSFLEYLLSGVRAEWKTEIFLKVISSEEFLLKCLGIIEVPDEVEKNTFREMREKIVHVFNMYKSIAKRMPQDDVKRASKRSGGAKHAIKYPIALFLVEILPYVIAMIRTLHHLYTPEIQNHIPIEKRNSIFHIGIDEKRTMLKQTFISSQLSEYEYYLYTTHKNLRKMRAYCYELLGYVCKYCDTEQFWGKIDLFTSLSNSIFSFLDYIDNRDLKVLLSTFLLPFVMYCPKEYYTSLLLNTLPPLYNIILIRLDTEWNKIAKGEAAVGTSTSEEVINEIILRDLTQEVLEVPLQSTKSLQKSKENKTPHIDDLARFILDSEQIIGIFLMTAARVMGLSDTSAVNKSISFTSRVIFYLKDNKKLHVLIGAEILQTAVTALMVHKQEMHQPLMNLIADIYLNYAASGYPEKIFLQLPDVKPGQIKQLNQSARASKKDGKKFKTSMRNFLKTIAGKSSGEFHKRKTILKIGAPKPQKDNTNLSFLDSMTLESVANLFK